MALPQPTYSTTVRTEQSDAAETQEKDLKLVNKGDKGP